MTFFLRQSTSIVAGNDPITLGTITPEWPPCVACGDATQVPPNQPRPRVLVDVGQGDTFEYVLLCVDTRACVKRFQGQS